jgi:hypothetical protein
MDARLKSAGMTEKEKLFQNVFIRNPEKQIEYLRACSKVVYSTSIIYTSQKD